MCGGGGQVVVRLDWFLAYRGSILHRVARFGLLRVFAQFRFEAIVLAYFVEFLFV